MIENYGADATILNQNKSNLLHILFANYNMNLKYASKLADLLIEKGVSLNLIDREHKTPLLVALKKSQIEAVKYAHNYNTS